MSNPSPWPITPSIESTSLVTLFGQHSSTPTPYAGQLYLVPSTGIVFLQENPLQTNTAVPTGVSCLETSGPHTGILTEVLVPPTAGQFYVDYYNGSVQFGDIGATVAISYQGVGSVVLAETINNIVTYLIAASNAASFVSPNYAVDPGSPAVGQIWFNTTDKQFKGWNGTAVVILG